MARINYGKLYSYNPTRRLYHKSITVTLADDTKKRKRFFAKNLKALHNPAKDARLTKNMKVTKRSSSDEYTTQKILNSNDHTLKKETEG